MVLWTSYSNFILLWELRDITRGVPNGALGCAAAFAAGGAALLHCTATFRLHLVAAASYIGGPTGAAPAKVRDFYPIYTYRRDYPRIPPTATTPVYTYPHGLPRMHLPPPPAYT